MAIKIDKKIIGYTVMDDETSEEQVNVEELDQKMEREEKEKEKKKQEARLAKTGADRERATADIVQMHESVARPEMLLGSTYKLKTPCSDHAMYITINDIILNEGTEHEQRRPFEMFINSKNMDHFQWIVALTRITSAVFRKGGDITFLVEEMRAVFDPQGGYFKKGGKFMPSLVAEIGEVIEDHLKRIGMIIDEGMSVHQRAILDEKRAAYEAQESGSDDGSSATLGSGEQYPPGASLCKKCLTKSVIVMDGCKTCLACGDSKCG